jgi:hypothetical protein
VTLGLAAEFRSEKIPRNRLGTASVIPRKKMLIPRHSKVYGIVYTKARNGRKWHKQISFTKNPSPANRVDSMFSSRTCFETEFQIVFFSVEWFRTEFRALLLILFQCTEFRSFFSIAERFGTEFQEFSVPWNSRNSTRTIQLFRLFRLPRNKFYVGNCQPT